ncbi:MAG TPA: SUMF1/EgtB/PvdO family nonheme iron enzyme [Thermotogota bacterium]|nr:SUMF1/EgtB/PvdO family nonheme iron enzyme [Thermotogota bacterium]
MKRRTVIFVLMVAFAFSVFGSGTSSNPETADGYEMILVKGGTFQMGNTRRDTEGDNDEFPVHTVELTYDFLIGKYEVTNAEFEEFLNEAGVSRDGKYNGHEMIDMDSRYCEFSYRNGKFEYESGKGNYPVIEVTWWGGMEYCNWKSRKEGLMEAYNSRGNFTGKITEIKGYRLPTEAEWEYAARGGQKSGSDFKYSGSDDLGSVGWYNRNSGNHTITVGKKSPNELGVYDMSGNVWEWCQDRYGTYGRSSQTNPEGPDSGSSRVFRGGSWNSSENYCRVTDRGKGNISYSNTILGLRLSRTYGDTNKNGTLVIENPKNLSVYVNEKLAGEGTEVELEVEEGQYKIEWKEGPNTMAMETVKVERGITIRVSEGDSGTGTSGMTTTYGRISHEMVKVEAGSFEMGNTRGDIEGEDDETVHRVTLTYDYWIGKYEVTFEEYDAYCEEMGKAKPWDRSSRRGNQPVENVSWWDAIAYCNWLSEQEGLPVAYRLEGERSEGSLLDATGNVTSDITQVKGYRLPTEAEWEYAARGGHKSVEDYNYAGSDDLRNVGWYWQNSGDKWLAGDESTWIEMLEKEDFSVLFNNNCQTHSVGQKAPNELGIYDMSGNVWEWCHDWYGSYRSSSQTNPIGPGVGSSRIIRGGSFGEGARFCRVSFRFVDGPGIMNLTLGFRVCRTGGEVPTPPPSQSICDIVYDEFIRDKKVIQTFFGDDGNPFLVARYEYLGEVFQVVIDRENGIVVFAVETDNDLDYSFEGSTLGMVFEDCGLSNELYLELEKELASNLFLGMIPFNGRVLFVMVNNEDGLKMLYLME